MKKPWYQFLLNCRLLGDYFLNPYLILTLYPIFLLLVSYFIK